MKGSFSIHHDIYTGDVWFGSLPRDDEFRIGWIGSIENSSATIAHDVVDHAVSHRTKKYLTAEEELRALGGVQYRLGEHSVYDVANQVAIIKWLDRPIKSPPAAIKRHIDKLFRYNYIDEEMLMAALKDRDIELTPEELELVHYQFNWGWLMKEWEFNRTRCHPHHVHNFIDENIKDAVKDMRDEDSYGIRVYFDFPMGVFRWRHMRRSFL